MGILGNWLPEDPQQNAAARQGLLALGGAMMSARGQNFLGTLGQGLLAGAEGYNGSLAQQQQAAMQKIQQDRWNLENQETQAKLDKPMQLQRILTGGSPLQPNRLAGLPKIGDPPRAASAAPAAEPAPAAATAATASAPSGSLFDTYLAYGNRLTQAGYPADAKAYYDLAEKLRPKLKEQSVRTINGQRVMANVYEDGRTEQVDGFAPDMEKLNFQNTGGSTVALDPFSGKPVSTIKNTQSPDSIASIAAIIRGQNMTNERAKEQLAQGRTPAGYRQNQDGTLSPVLGGPADPRNKPPTEFQGKSAAFGARAEQSDKILAELEGKYRPSAINAKAAVESAWLVGGTLASGLNKYSLTANDQRAEQAQRDFVNAVLRQESGAAISEAEFSNAKKQYFPQPGDSKAVLAQKSRNRKLAIQGFQVNAGHAAFSAPTEPPPSGNGITFLGFE